MGAALAPQKLAEALAALEFLRNEKTATETARTDLAGNLNQALEDKYALTAKLDQMSSELRRMQHRAFVQEALQGRARMVYQAQIRALRGIAMPGPATE
jgi:hypothetical protein